MALEKQWTAWNFTKCKKSIHTAGKRICTVKERDCLGCTVQEMFKESFGKINDFVTVEWCHLGPGRAGPGSGFTRTHDRGLAWSYSHELQESS